MDQARINSDLRIIKLLRTINGTTDQRHSLDGREIRLKSGLIGSVSGACPADGRHDNVLYISFDGADGQEHIRGLSVWDLIKPEAVDIDLDDVEIPITVPADLDLLKLIRLMYGDSDQRHSIRYKWIMYDQIEGTILGTKMADRTCEYVLVVKQPGVTDDVILTVEQLVQPGAVSLCLDDLPDPAQAEPTPEVISA